MSSNSSIEWTDATWNPVTGCTKISPGCAHCYAERMALRLKAMGQANYRHGFNVAVHPKSLHLPKTWKKPRRVFVNSMGDLFHPDVSDAFIQQVFDVMGKVIQHQYQVLTKRAERLAKLSPSLAWRPNVWMGVTVENVDYISRIDHLRNTEAIIKFVSLEPLLGPVHNLNLDGIDWVILGGESGPGARPLGKQWARDVRDQCLSAGVPFFFKQWGGPRRKKAGRMLDGRTWDDTP